MFLCYFANIEAGVTTVLKHNLYFLVAATQKVYCNLNVDYPCLLRELLVETLRQSWRQYCLIIVL